MYYFIVNPSSRSGKGIKLWQTIQTQLNLYDIPYQVIHTTRPHHATKLAKHLSSDSKPKTVIVLGGDGTLNETINGLSKNSNITLGYIPTGSSNDFARSLTLCTKPLEALANILSSVATIQEIDYGTLQLLDGTSRRFVVSCGVGFDASICQTSAISFIKKLLNFFHLGKLSYIAIGIHHLFTEKTCHGTLILDDMETVSLNNLFFLSSHIHPYEGGGLAFCPNANYADGALDLCVVEAKHIPKRIFILLCSLFKKHGFVKGVHLYRCQKAEIILEKPMYLHTDGESFDEKVDHFIVSASPNDHYRFIR